MHNFPDLNIKGEATLFLYERLKRAIKLISCFGCIIALLGTSAAAQSRPVPEPKSHSAAPAFSEENAAPTNSPVSDKWALIVGIGKFKDPRIPGLKFAAKDAKDFNDYLIGKENFAPDHVRLLVDSQATRANILANLGGNWLPRMAHPDDLVVLYFSSHGSPADMDVADVNYLVTNDTDVDNLYATGIPMQELTRMIKARVHSNRVVIFLDACHSGATDPGGKGIVRSGNMNAETIAQGTGQLVISSSEPSERSWESTRDENGVFTKHLIAALSKRGPTTTLGEAFQELKSAVQSEVLTDHGVLQTPVMRSKWSGKDLVLAVVPAHPRQAELPQGAPGDPVFIPTVTTQGDVGYVNRDQVVSKFQKAQDYVDELKILEDGIRKIVDDSNKEYEAAKAKGTAQTELDAMKKRLQTGIDSSVARLKNRVQFMEKELETEMENAIKEECRARNLKGYNLDKNQMSKCVDITDGV